MSMPSAKDEDKLVVDAGKLEARGQPVLLDTRGRLVSSTIGTV